MMGALRRFLRDQRGVAAIEAALILPILLTMVAGIVEYSRVLLAQHQVRDILDETARRAVVTGLADPVVEADLAEQLATVPSLQLDSVDATTAAGFLTITAQCRVDIFFGALLPDSMIDFTFITRYPTGA